MPRICVFGCRTTAGRNLHVFPNPKKDLARFQKWVEICNKNLKITKDAEYYRSKRVCIKHFTENYKIRNNRISIDAIPTLLCDQTSHIEVDSSHLVGDLPLHTTISTELTTHTHSLQGQQVSDLPLPNPPAHPCSQDVEMDHNYCIPVLNKPSKSSKSIAKSKSLI